MVQLRGALLELQAGAFAASAQHERQQADQDAQREAGNQNGQAVAGGGAAVIDDAEGPHRPAVMKVERGWLRSGRGGAAAERDVLGTDVIPHRYRQAALVLQGSAKQHGWVHRSTDPASECCPASSNGCRGDPTSIDRGLDGEQCQASDRVRQVAALTGVARTEQRQSARGIGTCLLYTSPSPRDGLLYRMPSS